MFNARLRGEYLQVVRIVSAFAVLLIIDQFANGQTRGIEAAARSRFGISSIVFSPEGRMLAVVRGNLTRERADYYDGYESRGGYSSYNGEVEVWDLSTGLIKQRLKEFKGPVLSVTFSPDGQTLATGSWESFDDRPFSKATEFRRTFGVVKVWDVKTGGLVWSQKAYSTDVTGVAFTPDGRTLASSGTRRSTNFAVGEVKLWNALTGELNKTLEYRTPVLGIAFSPDGKMLAVRKSILNEAKGEVKLWNIQTGKEERTLKADKGITLAGVMRSVAFSHDGKTLALAVNGIDNDEMFNEIQLWDVTAGKLKRSLLADKILVKGMDKITKYYWRLTSRFLPPGRPTASIVFSADGKSVASANCDVNLKMWDVESGEVKITGKSQGQVASVALSPDGSLIATGEYDNNIRLWETGTGSLRQTLEAPSDWAATLSVDGLVVSVDSILSVAFFPDGKTLAGATSSKAVKLWDIAHTAEKKSLSGHEDRVSSIAILPDHKTLLSGSGDQTVKLWNADTGEIIKTFAGHTGAVTAVAASPDGKLVASASSDRSINVWGVETGDVRLTLRGHDGSVSSVAFSPDGKTIASGSLDSTVRLWDAQTGLPKSVVVKHQGSVSSVAFSPDGKMFASAGYDKTVKLWDTETGELKQTMTGHEARVNSVAFSPDGSVIASGSDDKTVRLWYTQTGTVRRTLKGHDISVYCVGFSPDGKTLASGSGNNSLVIWDWQTGELKRVIKDAFKIQLRGARDN